MKTETTSRPLSMRIGAVLAAGLMTFGLAACDSDADGTEQGLDGSAIEQEADQAGQDLEQAGDDIQDGLEDAGEEIDEAVSPTE